MFRTWKSANGRMGRHGSGSLANGSSRGGKRRLRTIDSLEWLEDRTLLSMIVVNNLTDTPASGQIDLRQAIVTANGATSPTAIEFELGSGPVTIALSQGQLELSNKNVATTIYDGPGEGPVTISGSHASRVFQIDTGVTASLSNLTITGGSTSGFGGGVYADNATLTLTDCTISGNSAGHGGGLLINEGSATLNDCTIDGNSASAKGGGLDNYGGTATLKDCTISGNTASSIGGIIAGLNHTQQPTTNLYDTTVADNSATSGVAGLYNQGTATLDDTIVAGNNSSASPAGESDIGGSAASNVKGSYNLIGDGGSGGISNGVKRQHRPAQHERAGPGRAGRLRRADPDDPALIRQSGHWQGEQFDLRRHVAVRRSTRILLQLVQPRHRRLPDQPAGGRYHG